MKDFASARTKMVDSQLRTGDVTDYDVLAAMGEVPRELFVPAPLRPFAYIDDDLQLVAPAAGRPGRWLMRPAPFARSFQALEIDPSQSVLDVGCGTGIYLAVLARFAKSVVAVEADAELARLAEQNLAALGVGNVRLAVNPLEVGYDPGAPYDTIVVEGAIEFVPDDLLRQLAINGRLIAIIGAGRSASAMLFTKSDRDIGSCPAFDAYAREANSRLQQAENVCFLNLPKPALVISRSQDGVFCPHPVLEALTMRISPLDCLGLVRDRWSASGGWRRGSVEGDPGVEGAVAMGRGAGGDAVFSWRAGSRRDARPGVGLGLLG